MYEGNLFLGIRAYSSPQIFLLHLTSRFVLVIGVASSKTTIGFEGFHAKYATAHKEFILCRIASARFWTVGDCSYSRSAL